jgi:GcrA cell cycle regulator
LNPAQWPPVSPERREGVFPEFGQSPKYLDLDLDSYEESWTHIAAFRGQSGWLLVARATIQSEHDLLRTTLVAACDENETPIPAWRAMHLTQCRWDRLDHCYEEPPEILDDLLCEEEGAFYARWQREMNTGLAALYDRAQRNIEALEARATARTREVDLQIADLRRRRRMADASDEARATITEIIAELETEHDQAITHLSRQRSALRQEADATEEALWQRTDILIEVEPLCLVRWRAKSNHTSAHLLSPEQPGSGGISLLRVQQADLSALTRRRAKEALEQARRAETARAEALARQAATEKAKKPSPQSTPDAKPKAISISDLPKASPFLRRLAATAPQPVPVVIVPPPIPPPIVVAPPQQPDNGKIAIEREMLAALMVRLEEKGRKFFPGSRKYVQNQEERTELAGRIAALDAAMAGNDTPSADQPNAWPVESVEMLRRLWLQGMSANDIGRAIGGVSRNAVIGKAKRLGLPMRAQTDMSARQSGENKLAAES